MILRVLTVFLFSTLYFSALAQSPVSGSLKDPNDNSGLIGANVSILTISDSSIVKAGMTDLNGNFTIPSINPGNYILKASYLGYQDLFKRINVTDQPLDLGSMILALKSKELKEVTIQGQLNAASQKGDTTQFNAGAFKTNPDANAEDLVTKMPGITVQDGKVQAQGEEVKRVLVDGKPYFGDDPNAVLKNMPAEVIDKIQIFDQQSDQAQFTGMRDGNTTKTMNITTRANMRNGTFGKVQAGYGYNNVYRGSININSFKENRKITLLAQSNNINEQNFSSEDLAGVMAQSGGAGRGGMRGGGGPPGQGGWRGPGGGSNDFLVNTQGGISNTHAIGFNYSGRLSKTAEITGSYFFNWAENVSNNEINRSYVLPSDSGQSYQEQSLVDSRNINHRANIRLDWKIDTMNSILWTPKITLQQNNGNSLLNGETKRNAFIQNSTSRELHTILTASNFSNDLLYRHRFKKAGRTISMNLNSGYNSTDASNRLKAQNNYFFPVSSGDTIDQRSELDKKGWIAGTDITFTEMIGKIGGIQISYGNNYNFTDNNKETFNAPDENTRSIDTLLSSRFEYLYSRHSAGLGYRIGGKKLQVNFNANYQIATIENQQEFPFSYKLKRDFKNVLPSGMIMYNINQSNNIRLFYRTQTNQPNVEQLQDVLNNNNPLQLSIGNPALDQSYQHNIFVRFSNANAKTNRSFFAMIGGSSSNNYIANSTYIANRPTEIDGVLLLPGTQLTKPVNLSGYYNARSFINFALPMAIIKSNVNLHASGTFSRTPGLINNQENFANSPALGLGIVISSNFSQNFDFTVSSFNNFTSVKNTLITNNNSEYFSQNNRVKLNWLFGKGFVINTELSHQRYSGLSSGFNQNFLLWNGGFGYKFLKNKQGELRITVFDILNENTSISRNITELYTEDVRTTVLQRYAMLMFTYNIRSFKASPEHKKE